MPEETIHPSTPEQPSPNSVIPPSETQHPVAKNNKLKWLFFALLLLVIGAGTAFLLISTSNKDQDAQQPKDLKKISVRLGWLNQAQFAGMYVAKDKGYYKDAGLDVNLEEYQDGVDVTKEVADKKVDFGISTPLEVIASVDKGQKIKAISAIYQTSPYAIATPKTLNIKTPADLKGKTLGAIGGNTSASVTYSVLAAGSGINSSQFSVKSIDFDVVKDFKDKAADSADIYRTDQAYLLDQAKIEYNLLLPENFGFDIYGDLLVTSDQLIDQSPAIVQKFVEASMKGWEYAADHQTEALTLTSNHTNELYKDPAYEKHILTSSIPLIRPTGGGKFGSMQFVPWNRAYEGIKSAGLIKNDLEVNDFYTTEFVK
jgi:ABC-type nitrate/sulfonate/bicarbonate transport system substrate-binding protein